MKDSLRGVSRQQPIILFLFLSFALSWALVFPALWFGCPEVTVTFLGFTFHVSATTILSLLGNFGPAVAALIVLSKRGHHDERKALVKETLAWRTSAKGYLLAILIPVAILVLALVVLIAISRVPFHWYAGVFGMWLDSMIFAGLIRAFGEEIGWRGFLLPRLQERMNGLDASAVVGLVWWTWHLPVRLSPHHFQLLIHLCYLVEIVSLSIILAWVKNLTSGSLVPVAILHAAFNSGLDTIQFPNQSWYLIRWNLSVASAALFMAGLVLTIAGKRLEQARNSADVVTKPTQLSSEPRYPDST